MLMLALHPAKTMPARWLSLLIAIVCTGCTSAGTAGDETGDLTASATEGTPSGPVTFEGGWPLGAGAETPFYAGCDGQTVSTAANAWEYSPPNGSRHALITVEGDSAAPIPPEARLCVFGLEEGVYSVVGPLPLEMDVPVTGGSTIQLVVHPGNAPPSLSADVVLKVIVQPSA